MNGLAPGHVALMVAKVHTQSVSRSLRGWTQQHLITPALHPVVTVATALRRPVQTGLLLLPQLSCRPPYLDGKAFVPPSLQAYIDAGVWGGPPTHCPIFSLWASKGLFPAIKTSIMLRVVAHLQPQSLGSRVREMEYQKSAWVTKWDPVSEN